MPTLGFSDRVSQVLTCLHSGLWEPRPLEVQGGTGVGGPCAPSLSPAPLFSSPASRGCPAGGGKPAGAAGIGQQLHSPGLLLPAGTRWGKDAPENWGRQRERLGKPMSLHTGKGTGRAIENVSGDTHRGLCTQKALLRSA